MLLNDKKDDIILYDKTFFIETFYNDFKKLNFIFKNRLIINRNNK